MDEPVNNHDDVAGYCAQYVTKEGAWWNKLLGCRIASRMIFRSL